MIYSKDWQASTSRGLKKRLQGSFQRCLISAHIAASLKRADFIVSDLGSDWDDDSWKEGGFVIFFFSDEMDCVLEEDVV